MTEADSMLAPLPPEKWTFAAAAHLRNRAGFGGTPEEIEALHQAGREAAVDQLLHPPNEAASAENPRPWMQPEDLDNGDLKFNTDFRSVYGSVLENWLGAPSAAVLGRKFPLLPLG